MSRQNNLESRMVLHRFMCNQFGYKNLREMLNRLEGVQDGLAENNTTHFYRAIDAYLDTHSKEVTKNDLARYDENIIAHSQTLRMTADNGKSWKPFQYVALLFTERYLDLYFQDPEVLVEKLNQWKKRDSASGMADYTTADLRTLAFQSATGSGKTLLLHANILQYKHYLKEYKRLHKLNKIILVTPDEGLSRQHLRELQSSGIPAQLFSDNSGGGMFSHSGGVVDIIDLHKLDDKKGIKRVALASFEENNLVMVDEGHLGTGGKVWRNRRKQLAKNGFTFEYSATFNQAVSGSGDDIKKLRDEYGKSMLFDYSYRFFYEDGYGKDYKISNLQQTDDGEANNFYLLACLLMFYQQCRIFEDKGGQWREFNIAPPLWVFLGKTVTGGKSVGEKETETDVVRIITFLAWVQSQQQEVIAIIQKLISNNTGLVDEQGTDLFSGSFSYLKENQPKKIYEELCSVVFRGKGQLHISHLSGMDEIQLSTGDASPFGVINVGNASGLYSKLGDVKNRLFTLSKDAFSKPLFADVDNNNSPVNIVIGARKFAAGWNSWRVSTMGLMHVGTGEGPQIIQMFGRGVRLKGRDMSLKRHTALEDANPQDSDQLKLLETLNIFGLKANYMDKFKDYLQQEDINDRIVITLLTKQQFGKTRHLKMIRKRDSAGEFQYSPKRIALPSKPKAEDNIRIDRYQHLQILESRQQNHDDAESITTGKLKKQHVDLINKLSVYHRVLERKHRLSWHNMTVSQKAVDTLLENGDWYELYIPLEKLEFSEHGRVREWEDLAVDLICEYADQYWRKERNIWEHQHMEVVPLDDDDPNHVYEYKLSVDAKERALIKDIEQMAEDVKQGQYNEIYPLSGGYQLSLLNPGFHAYIPLLHARPHDSVKITPIPLNEGEAKFVKYLKDLVEYKHNFDVLQGKEIYLMRNMSRGKGVSFFDDYAFYPDFILWVRDSKRQDILFIDPKGLSRYDAKTKSKVDLHKRIKDTEKKIQQQNSRLFLHSYIWSATSPKNIGSDSTMTEQDCRGKGIFLASGGAPEIKKLLHDALN
ncbi:DEAD/DEAH box helicase family protein [Candidatus Spongiihabitans sp.]|uniref:DEAD/DEAH box helicase family protein n=1 Tax=Candidatus Spongiihabitans sp. TaxID=3101308 RepID=UPI003C7EA688